MRYREATVEDIQAMQEIRHAVKENVLSDPSLVTEEDYIRYMTQRGKGWICANGNKVVGFAIADLQDHNIWALFIRPEYEGRGIGKNLHRRMLDWYFSQTTIPVWLSTEKGTRAERFYRKLGWRAIGPYGKNEIKFEMEPGTWEQLQAKPSFTKE